MSITLTAGHARAVLYPHRGGLLSELSLAGNGSTRRKILWLPDDFSLTGNSWPGGGAPLLFPFAGRVFHQGKPFVYTYRDQVFSMPLHGFAYTMPWHIVATGSDYTLLQLEATAQTRAVYPFEFALQARYSLVPRRLTLDVQVQHRGPEASPMPVAIGWHPYFCTTFCTTNFQAVPELHTSARQEISVLKHGAAGQAQPIGAQRNGPISQPGLANLILAELAEPKAKLVDAAGRDGIVISWQPHELCRYLVLWSRDPLVFFCVEPWMGLPDAVHNGQGVVWLEAGQSLKLSFAVSTEV